MTKAMTLTTRSDHDSMGHRSRGVRVLWVFLLFLAVRQTAYASDNAPAWEKSRTISNFQLLISKSPFALPTAEETSPLSERYAMTGIISIGGKEQLFVFDRNDQSRELLTTTPNAKNMMLVSIQREGTAAPTKATIRVGNETGTISYLEASAQPAPGPTVMGAPQGGRPGIQLPPLPSLPKAQVSGQVQPGQQPNNPPTRRIIRRPVVAPQQTAVPK